MPRKVATTAKLLCQLLKTLWDQLARGARCAWLIRKGSTLAMSAGALEIRNFTTLGRLR